MIERIIDVQNIRDMGFVIPIALGGLLSFLRSTKKIKKGAEEYGGSDIDHWHEYGEPNGEPSFDKGGHRERSIANDPNHEKHWRKEKKKRKKRKNREDEEE